MKRVSLTILVFVTSLIVISACKKSNKIGTGGGNGGNATLLIIPEHHGQFVDTCRLYIKFGTLDAPANGVYDDSSSCVLNDTTPVAVFPHLTKGIYYVYGIGFHALYTPLM